MSEQEVKSALDEVGRAVDRLNRVFNDQAQVFREAGQEGKLREWLKGCLVLRDSGDMYFSWAQHYAKGVVGDSSADDDELVDEGASFGPPGG